MTKECAERAGEALRMAESDPRHAVLLAERAYRLAISERDVAAASLAKRAWGYAAFHLEDTDIAVRHLRGAIRLGQRAGSAQLTAEARMALAAVLTWRGRPAAALREIDGALAGLTGVRHARALVQQGAILQLLGRPDEALPCYRNALPPLRRAGDLVWVQRILLNRGVMHAQRREFGAALDDLHSAENVCAELGLDLALGFVHQNLGFVHSRRGDVPAALSYLDRAESRFRELRSQLWSVLSDRAELLLSVRLITEARAAAAEAVAACERERRKLVVPEARLLLARAALLDGDMAVAADQAGRARREFTRHGKPDWAALAHLTVLSCRLGNGREPAVSQLERIAEALAALWPDAALEARLAAASVAIRRGRRADGMRLLSSAGRYRRHGVATLRARAWYAEARLASIVDDPIRALHAARAGLRILDEHVAGLGATDLRAHAAGHRTELAETGLHVALRDGRPHRVFEWAERGRASHLAYRPARPPHDRELAHTLDELRATVAELNEQRGGSRPSATLLNRQMLLERRIRDHHRRRPGIGTALSRPPSVAAVSRMLAGAVLLELIHCDGSLLMISVIDGRARLHTICPLNQVTTRLDALGYALRQLTRLTLRRTSRDAASALLERTAGELDSLLLGQIPLDDRALVIVPTGPLQSLPWAILPSCRGRPVTVAPSAGLWLQASRPDETGPGGAAGRVVVATGPDLPGASAEGEAVAAIYGVTPLSDAAATVAAVTAALDGARLAHLATHGRLRADNPLFSSLRFADGPLMAHDIETLDRTPDIVVLAACETGRAVVRAGDELMGLGATLLAHGARQLVAPVLDVLDVETAPLMIAFHQLLATGQPAAKALADAQLRTAADHPAGLAAVAPFICLGGLT